jgi:hypothetical protein
MRKKVIKHYGSQCSCCGEKEFKFLTIDHINNDGATHRKLLDIRGGGKEFCRWIIKNNYPTYLQILCWNCNCAKGYWGKCPHT